jgi:hypothetical protein
VDVAPGAALTRSGVDHAAQAGKVDVAVHHAIAAPHLATGKSGLADRLDRLSLHTETIQPFTLADLLIAALADESWRPGR